jgi:threonine dehydratase
MARAPLLDEMTTRHRELAGDVVHTPTVISHSARLLARTGARSLAFKLEQLQHTGTFKARGALSVVNAIGANQRVFGITAVSAGNHAIAAAWAARRAGLSATVVMQSNANPFRVAQAKAEGATVVMAEPGPPAFAEAERLEREEKRTFVHPFEGVNTTLGSAGVGLELVQDAGELDAVVVAVGGGGLISGVAAAVKAINPNCAVYGVEPEGADAMTRSRASGAPVTLERVSTIADSLGPPMTLPYSFAVCQQLLDDVVTIDDDRICAGVCAYQQELKLAVEPAAGAALAGALGPLRTRLEGKRVGIVVCGANIDAVGYAECLTRGAAHLDAFL